MILVTFEGRMMEGGLRYTGRLFFILAALASLVRGAQQSFRERPSDQEAIQGQTTLLRCRINNMHGQQQWTKDGFGLGEDRDLPGFPSYQLIGNVELGEHDLMISNVQLEDDAVFSCQVMAFGNDPPLQAFAKLSVLVPPDPPVIDSYTNGSVVEVPHRQETIKLTCSSQGGKPAADIRWLKDGEEVTEGIEYKVTAQGNKLQNAESKLTLSPTDEDNGAFFTCETSNPALYTPQKTTVKLSVMHPPGVPKVSGYSNGQVVKTGDTLKLICVSEGGNPLAQVYWYKNGKELDFSYSIDENRVENEIVFTVQPNDNAAVYRCEASNRVTITPLYAEFRLTVQFAPESVTISGHQDAKAGESIRLSCVSAISNPPAVITWFSRGRQITGTAYSTQPSPQGGYISKSEIVVGLTDQENNVVYQCHATNDALGQTVVDTVTLTVMFPPEAPTISGYTEGREVTAGKILSLTCTSVGGNPLATLKWTKGGEELQGAVRVTGKIVSSQVSFILDPDDNQAEYKCSATNPATTEPLVDIVRLTVNFPPAKLEISTDPVKPKAGQILTVTCKSGTSNPASVLTWWKDGRQLQGEAGGIVEADFGGKSTISKLVMTPSALDNGQIYACRATNPLLDKAVSDAVTLDVRFIPYFPDSVLTTVKVAEGQSTIIDVTARANPSSSLNYTWYKNGELIIFGEPSRRKREIALPHFIKENGVINITSARRSDSGVYTVRAENEEGRNSLNVTLDVQYSAEVMVDKMEQVTEAGSDIIIQCNIKANPLSEKMVSWLRSDYDLARAETEYTDGRSTMRIRNVTKMDTGTFSCVADNGVGDPASANAHLIVKFAAEIDRSPALGKAASETMETGHLLCRASGAPAVTFTWHKGTEQLNVSSAKYNEESKHTGLVEYESTLYVINVTQQDYGQYVCVASNVLGSDTRTVHLDGTTKPDIPYNLRLVNVTHNSITITWTPGFDGGSQQTFQIRYQKAGDRVQKFINVHPAGATIFTVPDLSLGTEYEMTVRGANALGDGEFQPDLITVTTSAVVPEAVEMGDDVPLIIILAVSIIGMVLLAFNVFLILFYIRRRKRKLDKDASETTSQANTVELYNAPTITEDSKSYTSYNRSLDDFYDDHRIYGDDDEMKRFLTPVAPGPPGYPLIDLYAPVYGTQPDLYGAPIEPLDQQRSFPLQRGSREPIYMDDKLTLPPWDLPKHDPYLSRSQPHISPEEDDALYAEQLRKIQQQRHLAAGTVDKRRDDITGPKPSQSMGHLGDRPVPPVPPSNRVETPQGQNPPLPSRNYGPEDLPPRSSRYGPPGLNKPPPPPPPEEVGNPTRESPAKPGNPPSSRGHLV